MRRFIAKRRGELWGVYDTETGSSPPRVSPALGNVFQDHETDEEAQGEADRVAERLALRSQPSNDPNAGRGIAENMGDIRTGWWDPDVTEEERAAARARSDKHRVAAEWAEVERQVAEDGGREAIAARLEVRYERMYAVGRSARVYIRGTKPPK